MARPGAVTAYQQLRQWIVEGRLRPGERIVEARVAEELDLSRTPVREALRMLQSEGLVVIEPNRGTTVRALALPEIGDLYELRARLEALAAEQAAVRATPEQLGRLRAADAAFAVAAAAARGGDIEALRQVFHLNGVFHGVVLEASHHDRLAQALARTVDQTLVFQAFRHYGTDNLDRSAMFHGLIADAVAAGDAARAGRLVHEHVLQGRDQLLEVVGDADSVDALYDEPGHGALSSGLASCPDQ